MLKREPGADRVAQLLESAEPGAVTMGTANVAEVVGKLGDEGIEPRRSFELLMAMGIRIEPMTMEDALLAGALRSLAGGRQLSLGDRCCLALTLRSRSAEVWTGDRAWADLDLPIQVSLIR